MSSRELILGRVRRNQPAWRDLPMVPGFDRPLADPQAAFSAALARMGGVVAEAASNGSLDAFIRERFPQARAICSATPEVAGTRPIEAIRHPGELEDVDVGVVRAVFGVAETGSVWLSEREYVVNAIGFLPQHLIVLLDPKAIVPTLHHAYRHRGFFEARYSVLMTGPSATADIEGVLIRGAQGIRTLTVVLAVAGAGWRRAYEPLANTAPAG
jgi:L-lactate dehydrogenase complex protein LldG